MVDLMNAPGAARIRGLFCLTRNALPPERNNAAPAGTGSGVEGATFYLLLRYAIGALARAAFFEDSIFSPPLLPRDADRR
jgi:hypothetical protein